MSLYYGDHQVTLHRGDATAVLSTLVDESVDCIVTSPPYFGLRDYGSDGQYGLEETPAAYVETMRALFSECRRVLADDGTLWLNLGDSYYSGRGNPGPNSADKKQSARRGWSRAVDKPGQPWGQQKGLLGIPWRVAFALQDDGWILRNDIIWSKPNAMPESVTDRLSTRHEHLFMFAKNPRYWFDLDPIREGILHPDKTGHTFGGNHPEVGRRSKYQPADKARPVTGERHTGGHVQGKNPGDVWTVPTQPFSEAHFATMPPALAERCVQAGCKPHGTVLDPFSGSGTTGYAATKYGRRYVGIDLSVEYLDLSLRTRLAQPTLSFRNPA